MFITKPIVKLMMHTPEPEKLITAAAKLCYSNSTPTQLFDNLTDEDVAKFLDKIMKLGHGSILEHVVFTFAIEDISRVTEIQLCRHRTASPSIQSGRYVRRNPHFYLPHEIKNDEVAYQLYMEECERATKTYLDLIDRLERVHVSKNLGVSITETYKLECITEDGESVSVYEKERAKVEKKALEDARYVLPQALRTHAVYTLDLRNLIHLLSKRKCKRAQEEVREVANQMYTEIEPLLKNISKYIGAPCEFGKCPEGTMTCGKPYKMKL